MLYLDYSRKAGEWLPNAEGGNENRDAIAFLRRANEAVYGEFPGAVTIAEESTAFPGVSKPTNFGGLGFGFKWNMGWMHDTLDYMSRDPIYRRWGHDKMTFGLLYAFTENFVLPISHDEVVHGKRSVVGKMPGDEWQRFANARVYYAFMWAHPGKKLLFMGQEFGQTSEWNFNESLPWWLLDHAPHQGLQTLINDLNALYRSTPGPACARLRSRGLSLDRRQRRHAIGLRLPSHGRADRSAGRDRLQFHAGNPARLSHRTAHAGALAGDAQYRLGDLWRLERRQSRRDRRRAASAARLSGLGRAHPAAAGDYLYLEPPRPPIETAVSDVTSRECEAPGDAQVAARETAQGTRRIGDVERAESGRRYARHAMAYVLAGGRGSRLMELTDRRAKPAVYFGGKSRIIDFALSNALNSGIRRIAVATQYKAHSLIRHLQRGWNFFRPERNESFDILPASQRVSETMWYLGTADAVYQNIDIIESYAPQYMVILAGDHIYKMDYEKMLQQHVESGADVTVGCLEASLEEATGFGVMHVDENDNILSFLEKPKNPPPMPGKPDVALCSMGIYVFETSFLIEELKRDAADPNSSP